MSVNQASFATQMTASIAAVNAVIATVGTLQDSPPSVIRTIYTAVGNALLPYQNAIAAFETDIIQSSVAGVVAGIPPPQLATTLINQTTDFMQEWQVILAQAYLTRVGVNAYNAPG